MTLSFHNPKRFFHHHSRAKNKINLFVDDQCFSVDKIISYAPAEINDVPGCHITISRGFTTKVEFLDKTAIVY